MLDQHTTGIYSKFMVTRLDGRGCTGGDRSNAKYFVLDLTYDPHAKAAAAAYAASCAKDYPQLSKELLELCRPAINEYINKRVLLTYGTMDSAYEGFIGDISQDGKYIKVVCSWGTEWLLLSKVHIIQALS